MPCQVVVHRWLRYSLTLGPLLVLLVGAIVAFCSPSPSVLGLLIVELSESEALDPEFMVFIDDDAVDIPPGKPPYRFPLRPGDHVVVFYKDGKWSAPNTVRIRSGQGFRVTPFIHQNVAR